MQIQFWIITLNVLLLFFILIIFFKSYHHRRNAVKIISVYPVIKIFSLLLGLWVVIDNFSSFVYLSGYILSIVLLVLSVDIIVEQKGIHFCLEFMPWQCIKEITDQKLYLLIKTSRLFGHKGFVKFIWQVKDGDVRQLQQYLSGEVPVSSSGDTSSGREKEKRKERKGEKGKEEKGTDTFFKGFNE